MELALLRGDGFRSVSGVTKQTAVTEQIISIEFIYDIVSKRAYFTNFNFDDVIRLEPKWRISARALAVCTKHLKPNVVVMKSAKDRLRSDGADPLNWASDLGLDHGQHGKNRREPAVKLHEEPAIAIGQGEPTFGLAPQYYNLAGC